MLGVAALMTPVSAQVLNSDLDDLRYRLRQLEQQFKSMTGGGGDFPSSLAVRFQNRLNQMERALQQLTSDVEDLGYRISEISKENQSFKADVDYRLGLLEKNGDRTVKRTAEGRASAKADARRIAGLPAGNPPKTADPERQTGPTILPPGKEIDQYNFAIGELRKARYDRAARAFREFLEKHPDGQQAGNAYYWLGETYLAQKKYREAAIRFADGYQKFPKHPKAPDNLLKLGLTMAKLNKSREACASWAELRRRYPEAPGYVKRRITREWKKLGCRT